MQIQDPQYRERTLAAFAHQPWAEHLGMQAGDLGPGWFEIHLPLQTFHQQHDGIVHGGVLATLADTAVALAAYTLAAKGQRIVTIEFKINYLRPAQGKLLLCRGQCCVRAAPLPSRKPRFSPWAMAKTNWRLRRWQPLRSCPPCPVRTRPCGYNKQKPRRWVRFAQAYCVRAKP